MEMTNIMPSPLRWGRLTKAARRYYNMTIICASANGNSIHATIDMVALVVYLT